MSKALKKGLKDIQPYLDITFEEYKQAIKRLSKQNKYTQGVAMKRYLELVKELRGTDNEHYS
jgi:hypothetical protein